MSESTRCYSSGEVFKNTLWKNVFRQQAQVLFDRMNDANGKKVQKQVMENQQLRTTDYLNSFQYLDGKLDFLPHAEGYVKAVHTGSATEYHYVYNYTDHLGNIRLSYGRDPETGEIAILKENHYYPFGLEHQGYVGTHKTIGIGIGKVSLIPVRNYLDDSYRYTFGGKEEQPELGLNWIDHHARNYDAALGRWMNVDPLGEERESISLYNFVQNNPLNRIDPDGRLDNPVYDTDGNFLGTDDRGLQGDAIVMNKGNFSQGMAHSEAKAYDLFPNLGFMDESAKSKMNTHFAGLKDRPDYDGFVTIAEGIKWAKEHPNTLPDNITPDNSLYLDASKLNFGNLSVNNFPIAEGKQGNVNLFDYVNFFSKSSRYTTYALGNTQMKLLNAKTGSVQLFSDYYDWDVHPGGNENRNRLIKGERALKRLDDSHGFKVYMYGTGKIKTK